MKILSLVPEVNDVTTPEMVVHMEKCLRDDTELVHTHISHGPLRLKGLDTLEAAIPVLIEDCKKAEEDGFDGIFINCCGDTGVKELRKCVNIPVLGGLEAGMYNALAVADKITVITILPEATEIMRGIVDQARLNDRIVNVRYVEVQLDDVQEKGIPVDEFYKESLRAVKEDGAEAILIGCTAMFDTADIVMDKLLKTGYSIPVLDPAKCAVMLLEDLIIQRIKQSRLTYPKK